MRIRQILCAVIAVAAITFLPACGGGGDSGGASGPSSSTPPPPPPGSIELEAGTYSVNESATNASIVLRRTGGSGGAVSVSVATSDVTATAAQDYGALTTSVTFGDGDVAPKTLSIPVLNDTTDETDETFRVTLSAPTGGATLGTLSTATLTVTDDDLTTRAIRGDVSGLVGHGLVLQNNGTDDLTIGAGGSFAFATAIAEGVGYAVTIKTQPEGPAQTCAVTNGSGTVGTTQVSSVSVSCTTAPLQSLIVRQSSGNTQDDLLIVNEDGSGLVALANSTDDEYLGGVTPGGRMAYRRDGGSGSSTTADVYSVLLDGTGLVALEQSASRRSVSAVTADNRVIIQGPKVTSFADEDLFAVDADGATSTTLANTSDDEEFRALTPSGRVVYSRTTASQDDIYVIGTDGSGNIQLTNFPQFDEFVAVTPGGRILFHRVSSGRDLYSVREDGSGLAPLANDARTEELVAVLPNERVVFRREQSSGSNTHDLFAVNVDGTALVTLAGSDDDEYYAGITPEGRVLFNRYVGGSHSDVYSVGADGAGLVALAPTAQDDFVLGISSTGKVLLGRRDGTQTDLFVVDGDGTGEVRITDTPEDELPHSTNVWHRDRVVFARETGGEAELYSVRGDGTGLIQLTNSPADYDEIVAITPSGRVIFRTRTTSGTSDLYGIFVDGTGLIRLTNNADFETVEHVFSRSP
jgi:hypothetical protein